MARVSRTTAAKHRHGSSSKGNAAMESAEVYPSLNHLRSIQAEEEDERRSVKDLIIAGLESVYNFTIGSCICGSSYKNPSFDLLDNSANEDKQILQMKDILKLHFMNPFQKWNHSSNRKFPWKLLVQIVSIFLVTLQLVLFAQSKFAFSNFIQQNQATFSNLFIVNPQQPDGDDPLPDPIKTLYTYEQLQEQVNYTIDQFFSLESVTLGTYGYKWVEPNVEEKPPHILVTRQKYAESQIDPSLGIYNVSTHNKIEDEFVISFEAGNTLNWTSIASQLHCTLSFMMTFKLTTVFLEAPNHKPQCIEFTVTIEIQKESSSGNMPVVIRAVPETKICNQNYSDLSKISSNSRAITFPSNSGKTALDVIVIVIATISIVLCSRSFFNSWRLSRIVRTFFQTTLQYRLKFHQIMPLYNMWFVGIIISDIFVIAGFSMKILISYSPKANSLLLVDYTSIMIGLAVFGQWCGLLRFLSYLDKYNMFLITLRLAFPSLMRFIICTAILYMAFLLCGWLVLGPYHPKFRDPFVTSECLFSLVNGDDMYTTYISMSKVSTPAYVFSKVYLYIFIGLFIYVVLSVFISLISDTYETLHVHWYNRSKGLLKDFAEGKLADGDDLEDGGGAGHHHETSVYPDVLPSKAEEEDYQFIKGSILDLHRRSELSHSHNNGVITRSLSLNHIAPPNHAQVHPASDQRKLPQFQLTITSPDNKPGETQV